MQLRGVMLADTSHDWPPEEAVALYLMTLEVGEAEIVTRKADVDSLVTSTLDGAMKKS